MSFWEKIVKVDPFIEGHIGVKIKEIFSSRYSYYYLVNSSCNLNIHSGIAEEKIDFLELRKRMDEEKAMSYSELITPIPFSDFSIWHSWSDVSGVLNHFIKDEVAIEILSCEHKEDICINSHKELEEYIKIYKNPNPLVITCMHLRFCFYIPIDSSSPYFIIGTNKSIKNSEKYGMFVVDPDMNTKKLLFY